MRRITQLDGLRGLAIILVLIKHYFCMQVAGWDGRSVIGLASWACGLSWSGVDLFFVLSGFLITGILLDHRHTENFFGVFYLRRVCRIFPLYFLMIGGFVIVSGTALFYAESFRFLFHDPFPIWSYATFTQNILMGMRGDWGAHWLAMTWSLAVEEQFYFFVPLMVYFLPRRILVAALLAAVLAAPVLRCLLPGFHAFVNTPWRADSLLTGALLAILVRWHPLMEMVRKQRLLLRTLLVCFLAGAAAMTARLGSFGGFSHFWLAGLYGTLLLVAYADTEPVITHVLRSPLLVWLGQLSYGIYMFHQMVGGLLHGWLRHGPPEIHSPADAGITLLALAVTLLLAAVSFRYFESPILRFGHRFQYRPRRVESATGLPSLATQ